MINPQVLAAPNAAPLRRPFRLNWSSGNEIRVSAGTDERNLRLKTYLCNKQVLNVVIIQALNYARIANFIGE